MTFTKQKTAAEAIAELREARADGANEDGLGAGAADDEAGDEDVATGADGGAGGDRKSVV